MSYIYTIIFIPNFYITVSCVQDVMCSTLCPASDSGVNVTGAFVTVSIKGIGSIPTPSKPSRVMKSCNNGQLILHEVWSS